MTAIAVLLSVLGAKKASAEDRDFEPIVDGMVIDQSPFDGTGDAVGGALTVFVSLNSGIADFRGVMEFDLRSIHSSRRVVSATLEVVPRGLAVLPGTSTIPIQVFTFSGDGVLAIDDFNRGCFVNLFEGLAPFDVPIFIDVTAAVRLAHQVHRPFTGFSLRTNVHGAGVNFGSLEDGPAPKLHVTLR
jgi:hypothetical protein